jgi:hypothetical protein
VDRARTLQAVVAVLATPLLPCYVLARSFQTFAVSRLSASFPIVSRSATVATLPLPLRVPPGRRPIGLPAYYKDFCALDDRGVSLTGKKPPNVLIKTVSAVAGCFLGDQTSLVTGQISDPVPSRAVCRTSSYKFFDQEAPAKGATRLCANRGQAHQSLVVWGEQGSKARALHR